MNSLSRFSNIQFNYSFHLGSKSEFSTTISPFSVFLPSSLFLCIFSLRKITCYYYYSIGVLASLQEIRRTGDTTQLSTKRKQEQTPTDEKTEESQDLCKYHVLEQNTGTEDARASLLDAQGAEGLK